MLWPPWETVPECSPQIQAWDYLGGYYIRCRGNFRDSKLKNHLASAGPDYLLPLLTSSSFIHRNVTSRKSRIRFNAKQDCSRFVPSALRVRMHCRSLSGRMCYTIPDLRTSFPA